MPLCPDLTSPQRTHTNVKSAAKLFGFREAGTSSDSMKSGRDCQGWSFLTADSAIEYRPRSVQIRKLASQRRQFGALRIQQNAKMLLVANTMNESFY